ncbi:cell division protein FtsQ/DivIB [Thalassotalea fusca]
MSTEQRHPQRLQLNQLHWSFWLGVSFFIAVIIGMCSLAWYLTETMSAEESVPVTSIVISGEMNYTVQRDIEAAIETINLGNFFTVDVNTVQEQVSALPWVYSVSVRKKWPNELKIYVVDQIPVAFWNGDFLINHLGDAFQADKARVTHALPALYGPEGSENVALKSYRDFNRLLDYASLSIDELVLSERYSWQLILNDGVTLNLGREKGGERIQRFIDVYPEIRAQKKETEQVDYVDLRYDTGLAVGWKPQESKERA